MQLQRKTNKNSYMRSVEWCHFQWSWVISKLNFKVTIVKISKPMRSYTCNGRVIGSRIWSFDWYYLWYNPGMTFAGYFSTSGYIWWTVTCLCPTLLVRYCYRVYVFRQTRPQADIKLLYHIILQFSCWFCNVESFHLSIFIALLAFYTMYRVEEFHNHGVVQAVIGISS